MSYDFRLFARSAGEDPLVTARRAAGDFPSTPPDPEKEAHKHHLAEALMRLNPRLKPFAFGYDEIAKLEKITVDEARAKYRHIELNGPEGGNGIQITIFDDEVSITVPYWHTGQDATGTFREIWSYLELVEQEAGYLAYDPQLERILDLHRDFDDALHRYTGVVEQVKGKLPPSPAAAPPPPPPPPPRPAPTQKKPWWRFW